MRTNCLKWSWIWVLLFFVFSCSKDEKSYPYFIKTGSFSGDYFPTTAWRECAPEEVGMDAGKLKAVYDYCADEKRNTYSFIIIKDGYIVAEYYFKEYSDTSKLPSYSIAKSFTSALTGVAIHKEYLGGVDDKIFNYFPEWQQDGTQQEKKEITIKHLLTMTSGLQWEEDEISYTNNDIYNLRSSDNYVQYVLKKPVVEKPGTVWNYSSGMPLLLGGIIENVTGDLILNFAKETLFKDLNIKNVSWGTDPEGHTNGAWNLAMSARDYAKLGYLYWKNGIWEEKQVLPSYWVTDTRKPALENANQYGYLWWKANRYADVVEEKVPGDTYMAVGLFQKYIVVIPSYNLVLVRFGEDWAEGENGWDTAEFISLVINSIE